VDGVISALVGLSLIVGNALVSPLSRVVRTRTGLLMLSAGAQAVLAVACGLLTNFFVVVALYLLYGVAIGLAMPVKQAYLNAHIPTAQRATIISLDSMFASSGGVLGQTVWGWVAHTRSIGTAWAWSGMTLLLGIPFYWMARRKDRRLDAIG
jgi:MFS family permease